jgi:3-oxoacyl-[acyl-carrier-protein] synthase III
MAKFASIASTGRYVPERKITNAEIEAMLGQPVSEWLIKNVGIHNRHWMSDAETSSDMAVRAAKQALSRTNLSASEVNLIIIASDTPDQLSPGTASAVQAKLGAINAGTYDINCACSSFVTALDVAAKTIATDDDYQYVLVVGVYAMSRFLNKKDKTTVTLFADGAGAVLLRSSDKPGFLSGKLSANGEYYDALGVYTGGATRPATAENITQFGPPQVQFVRKFPATFNLERWPVLIHDALTKAKKKLSDVSMFFFTQLNLRTIEATMGAMQLPMSKTHYIMDKWGYTGSACIPMALDDAIEQQKLSAGDVIIFCSSGGGLSMAVTVFVWG